MLPDGLAMLPFVNMVQVYAEQGVVRENGRSGGSACWRKSTWGRSRGARGRQAAIRPSAQVLDA